MPRTDIVQSNGFAFRAAIGLIVFLFALFILVLSGAIYRDWLDADRSTRDRAISGSQVVATNARWTAELARQALQRVDEALGPDIKSNVSATEQLIREAVANLPGNVKSYVVAADGETLFSTDPNVKPIDIRDRTYFRAVAEGARWYVSPLLVSRLDGNQIFVFSKRLERAGGFVGAAIISFDVSLLRDVWESLDLDEQSTVSIVRNDGHLVARYPFADGPLDLSGYVLFTKYLKENDVGAYAAVSPSDSVARIVGYRRVPGTDFVALSSVSSHAAYAQFRRNTAITLVFALPTAVALAVAIAWIVRLLRRDQQQRVLLSDALDLNRLLVRDTHHRVKNNLQAIISMVRMHPLPHALKDDLQNRIQAMSAVHEHLYRLDQFSEVNAATLIPAIVNPLMSGHGTDVSVAYDIDPVVIEHESASPLAILVNELVTNALKYAFPGRSGGTIRVSLKTLAAGGYRVAVSDNGVGFDEKARSTGLGTRLIRAMVVQLGATSAYVFDGGTTFMADVKPTKPAARPPKLEKAAA